MGEFVNIGGKFREIVVMLVPPHEGNPMGRVRIYREDLPEGAVVEGEESVQQVDEPIQPRAPVVRARIKKA